MIAVLERIYIHNYKCLVGFHLELRNTTLLLGDNGAGKTAVLEVLFALRKLLAGEARIADESPSIHRALLGGKQSRTRSSSWKPRSVGSRSPTDSTSSTTRMAGAVA